MYHNLKNIQKISSSIFLFLILSFSSLNAATNEDCDACHSDPELTTERGKHTISLYVDFNRFSGSVHQSLDCVSCHQDADVEEFPHSETLERANCGVCHEDADENFSAGIHGRALKSGSLHAPTCIECHGNHYILPSQNTKSLTYKMNIPILCGRCHQEGEPISRAYRISEEDILSHYSQNIHGDGLLKKGLIVTATCNDCHGNHLILPHTFTKSTVSTRNVTKTCTKCHTRIEELHVEVIHLELWERDPGSIPACTYCHNPHPTQAMTQTILASDRDCLKCHASADIHKTI